MEAFIADIEGLNSQVLAVSCDPVSSKEAWGKWLGGISFPLVADFWPHGEMTQAYGVFNFEFGRPDRATFIVDKQGIIRWIKMFKPGELPDTVQMLDALREIENSK